MYEMKICLSDATGFSHHWNDNAFLNTIIYGSIYFFKFFFI